ncbi:MAG: dockerin type I repeat-containing protein, partial [Clostridia bacterium]|nr:dockerin type I repeat-containing protein [Clostridia bacterium]
VDSVVERCEYRRLHVKYPETLTGNKNYKVTVAEYDPYGTLSVSGTELLELTDDSKYQFLFEKPIGIGSDVLRAAYGEAGYEHGVDDKEWERIVLGQILPNTSVAEFVKNIKNPGKLRLYNSQQVLIYDCGKIAEGFESLAENGNVMPVGTGWYVVYGSDVEYADVVYLSVLGDVNGDGIINAGDTSVVNAVIMNLAQLSSLEYRLAAYVSNSGRVSAADASAINAVIIGLTTIGDYFTYIPEDKEEKPAEPEPELPEPPEQPTEPVEPEQPVPEEAKTE